MITWMPFHCTSRVVCQPGLHRSVLFCLLSISYVNVWGVRVAVCEQKESWIVRFMVCGCALHQKGSQGLTGPQAHNSNSCTTSLVSHLTQVVVSYNQSHDSALLETILANLSKAGLHERAGEMYEHLGRSQDALNAFRRGHAYRCVCLFVALCA